MASKHSSVYSLRRPVSVSTTRNRSHKPYWLILVMFVSGMGLLAFLSQQHAKQFDEDEYTGTVSIVRSMNFQTDDGPVAAMIVTLEVPKFRQLTFIASQVQANEIATYQHRRAYFRWQTRSGIPGRLLESRIVD